MPLQSYACVRKYSAMASELSEHYQSNDVTSIKQISKIPSVTIMIKQNRYQNYLGNN